jgi:hypothetical protein
MMKQDLLTYWPSEADVIACVKTDAEASDRGVLLAVHQPMQFEMRVIGGDGTSEKCDEHDLLAAFLADSEMGG